jgi:hypothetical protein
VRTIRFARVACALALVASAPHADAADESSPKRALPDYDGRAHDDSDGAGIWIGRVLLSPLYFTSEYLLRRPIGALMTAAERADIPRKLYDFFAFGFDHKLGFLPVGLVDFGFNPSIGIYGFWNDAFTPGNDLHLHYEAWPTDWIGGVIDDRYKIDSRRALHVRVAGLSRPDNVFYGIGPSTLQSNQSRFTKNSFEGSAALEAHGFRSSSIEATLGLRKVDLSHGHFGDDPSIERAAAMGAFPIPYGFDRGYLEPYERVRGALDTRRSVMNGSGVRIEGEGELGGDVEHAPATSWIRYGASASAMIDLDGHGRVLSASVATIFVDPIAGNAIPFTELVTLGGDMWMHGYFPGRLVGRSAAVASLHYAWPIGVWFNGTMQAAIGNVFGEHLEGFSPSLFRLSASIGLAATSNPPLELLVGFGTETFQHGAQIDSVRVTLGVPTNL